MKQFDFYTFYSESFDSEYLLDIYFERDNPSKIRNIYYYKKVSNDKFEFVKRLSSFEENTQNKIKTAFDIKPGKIYYSIRNERPIFHMKDDEIKKKMDKISKLLKEKDKEKYSFHYVKTFFRPQTHAYSFKRTERKVLFPLELIRNKSVVFVQPCF